MPSQTEIGRGITRLLICLTTALVITASAYLCAWLRFRGTFVRTEERLTTRADLEILRDDIERHKNATGAWPIELTELKAVKEKRVRLDDTGQPVDGWDRPWQYRVPGGFLVLFSYGADGMQGGVGQNADLYPGQDDDWPDNPTLAQFTTMPEAWPMLMACILAGVIAFPICLLPERGQTTVQHSIGRLVARNAVTAVFAIIAALMISALHMLPGGH